MQGKLILLPSPIGVSDYSMVLPQGVMKQVIKLRHFVTEELRTARRFLRSLDSSFPVDDSFFIEYNEHTRTFDFSTLMKWLREGHDTGILSEAGMPCIADPGSTLVQWAHSVGITVVPLSGPSSIMLALAGSGLNGQQFAFNGYIPVKQPGRNRMISHFEMVAHKHNQTQIFIEAPYRNNQLIADVLHTCQFDTLFCIAAGISTADEYICTLPVSAWRKASIPDLNKIPAVFLIG